MIPINQNTVSTIAKQPNAKTSPGKDNPVLYQLHSASLTNMTDLLRNFSEYEMAHFINNNERWIQNRSQLSTTRYSRGDILIADLGAHNFRHEPSYPHPCVVLLARQYSLLIVPCSSKQYQSGRVGIIDATPEDGFTINTGIQAECYRWINKNRIIGRMGQASGRVLDEINTIMLSHIPAYKKEMRQKEHQIHTLNQQLAAANAQIEQLKTCLQSVQEAAATLSPSS